MFSLRRLACHFAIFLACAVLGLGTPTSTRAQTTIAVPKLLYPTEFFYIDISNGSIRLYDRARRDPLSLRRQRIDSNVFQDIGRSLDQPAQLNEILVAPIIASNNTVQAVFLVETTTGYVLYFDELGRNGRFGEITTVVGRPFADLASPDANFALLPKRGSNGATIGFFLYHASSGSLRYIGGVGELAVQPSIQRLDPLPTLARKITSTSLRTNERTTGYLIVDGLSGALLFLELVTEGPDRLLARPTQLSLLDVFEAQANHLTDGRFIAASLEDRDQTTSHLFFVDVGTGGLAVIDYDADQGLVGRLTKLPNNLYASLLPSDSTDAYRSLALTTRYDLDNASEGIWIRDSQSGTIVYLSNPQTPGSALISRVRFQ